MMNTTNENELPNGFSNIGQDPLYMRALTILLEHELASISLVQRHLHLGYSKALEIFNKMEDAGVIGRRIEPDGFRKILLDEESRLKMLNLNWRMIQSDYK